MLTELESSTKDKFDASLRPTCLDDYIGQTDIVSNFKVFIKAALKREETLDHILLFGPPGLGKTSLAFVIAKEMNAPIRIVNGPSIEHTGDLASLLSSIEPGEILFIDEIHRLPKVVEEVLYSAMEDYRLSIVVPHEDGVTAMNIDLPPFTIIGATTRVGDISSPLYSRFGITEKLNYYTRKELSFIVKRTAKFFKIEIDDESANMIAIRSRGTPRIANKIFKRVRDFATISERQKITKDDAKNALKALRIDNIGLTEVDIKYLITIYKRYNCGPVGVETIALTIGEVVMNLEDVYEPYLLQLDFINRTPKGRIITQKGIDHLLKNHKQYL